MVEVGEHIPKGLTREQAEQIRLELLRRQVELAEKRFEWERKVKFQDLAALVSGIAIPLLVLFGVLQHKKGTSS